MMMSSQEQKIHVFAPDDFMCTTHIQKGDD